MVSSEAKPLPSPTNPDFALLVPSATYAGSYTFTGDKVIHHIEASSIQNIVNTDQVRSVTFQGDRLTLRVGPCTGRGGVRIAYTDYVWERLKPETTP
jgi:hypothetical protein